MNRTAVACADHDGGGVSRGVNHVPTQPVARTTWTKPASEREQELNWTRQVMTRRGRGMALMVAPW
ncbi:MAG: hypothetical protein MK293_14515 [Pedosphaera sp.]|nr:hypothetical protein [Pedosphaera sp.]